MIDYMKLSVYVGILLFCACFWVLLILGIMEVVR
mgnify:CR=1 FL=1